MAVLSMRGYSKSILWYLRNESPCINQAKKKNKNSKSSAHFTQTSKQAIGRGALRRKILKWLWTGEEAPRSSLMIRECLSSSVGSRSNRFRRTSSRKNRPNAKFRSLRFHPFDWAKPFFKTNQQTRSLKSYISIDRKREFNRSFSQLSILLSITNLL